MCAVIADRSSTPLKELLSNKQVTHGDGDDGYGQVGYEYTNAGEIVAELAVLAQLAVLHFATSISGYCMKEGSNA